MIYINKTAVTEIKNSTSRQVVDQAVKTEEAAVTHSEKNTSSHSTSDDYVNLDSLRGDAIKYSEWPPYRNCTTCEHQQ